VTTLQIRYFLGSMQRSGSSTFGVRQKRARSGKQEVVRGQFSLHAVQVNFYKREYIMDNQKNNDGSARDTGREGAGSSMGKDMSKDIGKDSGLPRSTGGTGGTGSTGSTGSTAGSTSGASVIDKAKDMARDATKDMPTSADMHKSIDKAANAAQPVVDRLASSAHAGVDKLTGALSGAGATMDEKSRQLSEAAQRLTDTGREYVRTSPMTSLAVAAGVGYLLSKIFGGRR
jgi:ElaB/YqjD/DUF883 family membrane-anchored ribosome-binding protein